jgi:hypothetical protein
VKRLALCLLALTPGLALAESKMCRALNEDGSTLAEFEYEPGSLKACEDKLVAEAAKVLCKPGDKEAKFKLLSDASRSPTGAYHHYFKCEGGATAAAGTSTAASSTTTASAATASAKDPKCFAECNGQFKGCPAACNKDRGCINQCLSTFRSCSKGCGY